MVQLDIPLLIDNQTGSAQAVSAPQARKSAYMERSYGTSSKPSAG